MRDETVPTLKSTILIIDDVPENLALISNVLKDEYRVRVARDGEKGLKIAEEAPVPDLILLDVMMPGIDGYEVCRRLKRNPLTQDVPVIFLTGVDSIQGEVEGFEVGAVDYVTKPFNPLLIRARIATHLALLQARRQLEESNRLLRAERDLVAGIVNRMRREDEFCADHLRSLETPVEASNGDILLSATTADGRRWVAVGDMTGHGLRAAIACPLVTYLFYRAAQENWTAQCLLEELNQVLNKKLPTGNYMAATLVEINRERSRCAIWNAGLPECIVRQPDGALLGIESGGIPLGIVAGVTYLPKATELPLQGGERIYVFTDGLTEMCDPAGVMLDVAGVRRFLAGFDPAAESLDSLRQFVQQYRGYTGFDDDLTLVELAIAPSAA